MVLNMTGNWKKGLFVVGLATALFAAPVLGIEGLKGSEQRRLKAPTPAPPVAAGGGAYKIDFSAADPDLYNAVTPYPCDDGTGCYPKSGLITGSGNANNDAIPFAKFNDGSSNVKVESLMPPDLFIGQIVPFEIEITVDGLTAADDGAMQFTAGWSTKTTSGGAFGYNKTIGVYAAFIDEGDGAYSNNEGASVAFDWNLGVDDEITGVFDVTGLADGVVVVEVWVVIADNFPTSPKITGNVHSRLIDAHTVQTDTSKNDAINTGTQTVPMMTLSQGGPVDDSLSRLGTVVNADDLLCE